MNSRANPHMMSMTKRELILAFDPQIAARRFGYGLSPVKPAPTSVDQMLDGIAGPDLAAQAFPLPPFRHMQDAMVLRRRFVRFARLGKGTEEGQKAQRRAQEIKEQVERDQDQWFAATMLRRIKGDAGFLERLVAFWADHFTAFGGGGVLPKGAALYVEAAVRPNVSGRFADLLIACITHPLMIHYLDQFASAGPMSRAATLGLGRRGLNENLAREVLELHTLGVDGPYSQTDVRELARVFAGLGLTRDFGFKFRPAMAEPGEKQVLGVTYRDPPGPQAVQRVLQDIARHPATARHIARKLAVHFLTDDPPLAVITAIESAYRESDGALMACYEALLRHPAAWEARATNIRPPVEFMSTALRALDPPGSALTSLSRRQMRNLFYRPLKVMGQPWLHPAGPDGFAEEDAVWITPQGMAARLEWAMTAPAHLLKDLPDPGSFAETALGSPVPERVAFAARAAETRSDAVGLILTAPAFQRR